MKPSFDSAYQYTYSIINEPDDNRFVVVVYRKPSGQWKLNQQEIGRSYIDASFMADSQHEGSASGLVQAHFDEIVKSYEHSLADKQFHELTDKFTVENDDGTSVVEPLQTFLKQSAVQSTNAMLAGYLGALGVNAEAILPTDAMSAVVKKAAELKKAQIEGSSKQNFLLQELEAMKQSFKATAQKAAPYIPYPVSNFQPQSKNAEIIQVQSHNNEKYWDDEDWEDWDDEPEKSKPVVHKLIKDTITTRVKANTSFSEITRKFRD